MHLQNNSLNRDLDHPTKPCRSRKKYSLNSADVDYSMTRMLRWITRINCLRKLKAKHGQLHPVLPVHPVQQHPSNNQIPSPCPASPQPPPFNPHNLNNPSQQPRKRVTSHTLHPWETQTLLVQRIYHPVKEVDTLVSDQPPHQVPNNSNNKNSP